jgi:hypothetical protein
VRFLLSRQPWPLEDEAAAALAHALRAGQADNDAPPTPGRTAAIKIEAALQRAQESSIRPTVGEARAILDAVEGGIEGENRDNLLDLYDTLHRWVERASRQM